MKFDDRKNWMWRDDPAAKREPKPHSKVEALSALMQAAALGEEDPWGEWALRARDIGATDNDVDRALDGGRAWRLRALEQLEENWRNGQIQIISGLEES